MIWKQRVMRNNGKELEKSPMLKILEKNCVRCRARGSHLAKEPLSSPCDDLNGRQVVFHLLLFHVQLGLRRRRFGMRSARLMSAFAYLFLRPKSGGGGESTETLPERRTKTPTAPFASTVLRQRQRRCRCRRRRRRQNSSELPVRRPSVYLSDHHYHHHAISSYKVNDFLSSL